MTDEEGRSRFPFVEAPLDYRLHVSGAPNLQDYQDRIPVTAYESEFEIVVEPYEFPEVSVRSVNLQGVPIPDLELIGETQT